MKILTTLMAMALVASTALATEKAKEVQQKTAEALRAAGEYTKEQKVEIQKNLEDKMSRISEEISDLKKDMSTASGKAKEGLAADIKSLEKKQKNLKADLARWKKSTGKAWEQMKNGMSEAMDHISESYQKAKKEYSETKSE